jgi:hypothetical protein
MRRLARRGAGRRLGHGQLGQRTSGQPAASPRLAIVEHAGRGVRVQHVAHQDGHGCCTPSRRSGCSRSDEAVLYGKARGGAPRGDRQLAIDGAHVRVDGMGTDEQALGNVRIGQPVRH